MESIDLLVVRVTRPDLEDMEWLFFPGELVRCCPRCYRSEGEPHRWNCWIARALGSLRDDRAEGAQGARYPANPPVRPTLRAIAPRTAARCDEHTHELH